MLEFISLECLPPCSIFLWSSCRHYCYWLQMSQCFCSVECAWQINYMLSGSWRSAKDMWPPEGWWRLRAVPFSEVSVFYVRNRRASYYNLSYIWRVFFIVPTPRDGITLPLTGVTVSIWEAAYQKKNKDDRAELSVNPCSVLGILDLSSTLANKNIECPISGKQTNITFS